MHIFARWSNFKNALRWVKVNHLRPVLFKCKTQNKSESQHRKARLLKVIREIEFCVSDTSQKQPLFNQMLTKW